LEKALESAIIRRLPQVTSENFKRLFDDERAPIGTVDAKILIADSLGILGKETLGNLDLIKHIRNTFAHAVLPIDFSTKQISDTCDALVVTEKPETFRREIKLATSREKYTTICEVTAFALVLYALNDIQVKADVLAPETLVPMPLAPLP
jgi:hypothetical protein